MAQVTVALLSPATAATPPGADGANGSVTEADGAEAGEVPASLRATTVKLYVTPLASPDTTQLVAAVVQDAPPGVAVAV